MTLVAPVTEERPPPPPIKNEVIYDVIKYMKKVSTLMGMFDSLCLSSASQCLLERVAARNGGAEAFFQQSDGDSDYVTDVE